MYELEMLKNGLVLSDIKIINPDNENETVTVKCLIDTGCDGAVICKSIFDQFKNIDPNKIQSYTVSTLLKEDTEPSYIFNYKLPHYYYNTYNALFLIKSFPSGREYQAIAGTTILRNYTLVVQWDQGKASLRD